MGKRGLHIALLLSLSESIFAVDSDNALSRVVENERMNVVPELGAENPAMMKDRYAKTLTEIEAGWVFGDENQPKIMQEGDGENRMSAVVDAFVKNGKNDIWGNAGYSIGQRRNVAFNETSDYRMLYPYVTADLVGGDLHEEIYRFEGGFAHRVSSSVVLGAQAGYRALLAYRSVDPRPRNLTGDLDFAAGVSWTKNEHIFGAALKVSKYKQTNDVEFYSETGHPAVYHATGLGTDYYRFRGSNTDTYYNGRGFGGVVNHVCVRGATAVSFNAVYDYFGFDKIISSLNELPMASVGEHRFSAALTGLFRQKQNRDIFVEAGYEYVRRNGTENIFGDAQNNIYPEIASLPMYRRSAHDAHVKLSYDNRLNPVGFRLSAVAGYHDENVRYVSPERLLAVQAPYAGIQASTTYRKKRWLLRGEAQVEMMVGTNGSFAMPPERNSVLDEAAKRVYEVISETQTSMSAALRADYAAGKRFAVFFRLRWAGELYAGGGRANHAETAVGLLF